MQILALLLLIAAISHAQEFPYPELNIPWLFSTAKNASSSMGDDDHLQVLYYRYPANYFGQVYLWVEEPGCGKNKDLIIEEEDSQFRFRIFGINDLYRPFDEKIYDSGTTLADTIIGNSDAEFIVLPGIDAWQGQQIPASDKRFIKILVSGESGDDGNYYRLFFSSSPNEKISIPGAEILFNELCFKIDETDSENSYLFVDIPLNAEGISLISFDWDNYGKIKIYSSARKKQVAALSGDNEYRFTLLKIFSGEKGNKLTIELIKNQDNYHGDLNSSIAWIIEDQFGTDISLPLPYSDLKRRKRKKSFYPFN